MPQITCPECDYQLSGNEEYCPNCGRSVPRDGLSWHKPVIIKGKEERAMQKLTTCEDCGEQISCSAKTCPHCGRVTDPTVETSRKASYRSAGKLMEKVAVGFLLAGAIGAICVAISHHISLDAWNKNILLSAGLGLGVFASCIFPASVCYGLGKLIGAKVDL